MFQICKFVYSNTAPTCHLATHAHLKPHNIAIRIRLTRRKSTPRKSDTQTLPAASVVTGKTNATTSFRVWMVYCVVAYHSCRLNCEVGRARRLKLSCHRVRPCVRPILHVVRTWEPVCSSSVKKTVHASWTLMSLFTLSPLHWGVCVDSWLTGGVIREEIS